MMGINCEEIKIVHYQLKLNGMGPCQLQNEVHYRVDHTAWKKKMAFYNVKQFCETSKENASRWFALEEQLKTMLENKEFLDGEEALAAFRRKQILRLEKRVSELKEYLARDIPNFNFKQLGE